MEKLGKKLKHDHTLTSILKFTIFAMVMLAPIFSVASRCLYVICNKNANQSYSDKEIQDTIQVTTSNNLLIENRDYIWTYIDSFPQVSDYVYFNSISSWVTQLEPNYTITAFRLTGNSNFVLRDSNNTDHTYYNYFSQTNSNKTFNFNFKSTGNQNSLINAGKLLLVDYKYQTMDNVFEYSLSQIQESSYYNWATNLGIYTPIHNMVSGLGGHDIIALLLAYWSIYTAIYIVFDIIIVCFVKITHLIQGE